MKTRFVAAAVAVLSICSVLSGCMRFFRDDYSGEYPELYSVAINSLLGTTGRYHHGAGTEDPKIVAYDEDSFGRKLFIYDENSRISMFSLIISQTSDEKNAYFYPDINFFSISFDEYRERNLASWSWPERSESDEEFNARRFTFFPEEAVEDLKRLNNWDLPLDLDRCVTVDIVRNKEKGPFKNSSLRGIYEEVLGEDGYNSHLVYHHFTDEYGRSIYLFCGYSQSEQTARDVLVLIQPDMTYDEGIGVMDLTDPTNYQQELKGFKEKNGWNLPLPQS